ncbi:MAG: hypothetical protein HP490_05890, partial [Nitrospira sp.]|nr:hypothetical protein [Nitrospira sp.]
MQTNADGFDTRQRQVSTIYNTLNQYHVVMEVSPEYWASPEGLKDIYVSTSGGAISGAQATGAITSAVPAKAGVVDPAQAVRNQRTNQIAVSGRGSASTGAAVSTTPETMVPLSSVTRYEFGTTPIAVNHQGLFVASTSRSWLVVDCWNARAVPWNEPWMLAGMPISA